VTPALLAAAGHALYGDRWKTELARDLKVAERTVRRWATGEFGIPPGLAGDVLDLLHERGLAIAAVRRRLRRG